MWFTTCTGGSTDNYYGYLRIALFVTVDICSNPPASDIVEPSPENLDYEGERVGLPRLELSA